MPGITTKSFKPFSNPMNSVSLYHNFADEESETQVKRCP